MSPGSAWRFGLFELDLEQGQLLKEGKPVRLAPQPFKLLHLLVSRADAVVTRDDIRRELWSDDTFVDFDQGVNFSIKQIREALGDDAEHPIYIQTLPRRGYRFIAPLIPERGTLPPLRPGGTDINLHKALWANIAELRMAEVRSRRRLKILGALLVTALLIIAVIVALARAG